MSGQRKLYRLNSYVLYLFLYGFPPHKVQSMRRPTQIERLYLDFDGFFASVEQQARSGLRGKPVGVVPFAGAEHTCVIACSREAKLRGVKNVMPIAEARQRCPDIILVPQSPDLYRRAHNALLSEISAVIPVDAVKSIDELTCRVGPEDRDYPLALAKRIKERIPRNIGPYITCSVGFAANRQLAKMACKASKRPDKRSYGDGCAVSFPRDMPEPLLALKLADIPGVGSRMENKLFRARIHSMADLLATQPSTCASFGAMSRVSAFGMPCTATIFRRPIPAAACTGMAAFCLLTVARRSMRARRPACF